MTHSGVSWTETEIHAFVQKRRIMLAYKRGGKNNILLLFPQVIYISDYFYLRDFAGTCSILTQRAVYYMI